MARSKKANASEMKEYLSDPLISEAQIQRRWDCSRSTVRRILEAVGAPVFYLTGKHHGLKRYRLSTIARIETESRAPEATRATHERRYLPTKPTL
jgi:hypothetical protein